MAVATFDTLKFANTLKAAGVPEKQAEAQAVAFAEVVQANFKELASRDDLDRAVNQLQAYVDQAVKELRREIGEARSEASRENVDLKELLSRKIDDLRRDVMEEIHKVNARLDTFQAKHAGDMALIRWMLGVIITLGVGVAARLFFFRPT